MISDCDTYGSGFIDVSWFLICAHSVHKEAAWQQQTQAPATVNNDNKSNSQAHELILWQAPPIPQRSGRELQSGDTAPLVICHNGGLTRFVWSCRPLSTVARATGSQSHSVCECACVGGDVVCVCVGGSPPGKGSLVSQFSALIGLNDRSFCCSAESLHLSSLNSQRGS